MKVIIVTEIPLSSHRVFAERRSFLRRSGRAVLSAAAITVLAGKGLFAEDYKDGGNAASDARILNNILGGEFEAVAAYQVGAESGLLHKPVLALAKQFQGQHKEHAALIAATVNALGGKPVEPKKIAEYKFPVETLKTQEDIVRFAAGLEMGAVSAYLSAVRPLGDRGLATTAASILADEAMHLAILRQVLGENPAPKPFVA